ncbi:hypothetical protein JTE90_021940 [Oedothorax gibbosus]|uniref:RNA-binding protein 42 n=1 Tax=Oedothorax gibbosus TaxID=931172 RepID=A0AAV6VUR3_9ARAC|nr:hypothetical protein JTE90_021940 [Oedothorax gibbosus]
MDLISEERRKEMEEEMNRFELEILGPGEEETSSPSRRGRTVAPLTPPPAPPVAALIPKILTKPPPPPPSISPPPLRPPPRPPHFQAPPHQGPRFIPAQVQRQPPRQHGPRGNFMGMRGPPGPFHHHQGPPMGHHFGPPMHGHGHGPMHPGDEMHFGGGPMMHGPMHPGPMMPMNMGGNLPMPPGFCPPGPPMGQQRYEGQFDGGNHNQQQNMEPPPPTSTNNPAVVASAPTIYAAPFKKTKTETTPSNTQSNGKEGVTTAGTASLPVTIKTERVPMAKPTPEPTVGPVGVQGSEEHPPPSKKKEKKKKIVRMAGGQAWEDNSLLEWDTDDFRIFCGDLGNDVTDEVLIRAFSKYPSFVKAKVVRDKRTNKTKGFGFVSFKDPQDFIKAMREMNG